MFKGYVFLMALEISGVVLTYINILMKDFALS